MKSIIKAQLNLRNLQPKNARHRCRQAFSEEKWMSLVGCDVLFFIICDIEIEMHGGFLGGSIT